MPDRPGLVNSGETEEARSWNGAISTPPSLQGEVGDATLVGAIHNGFRGIEDSHIDLLENAGEVDLLVFRNGLVPVGIHTDICAGTGFFAVGCGTLSNGATHTHEDVSAFLGHGFSDLAGIIGAAEVPGEGTIVLAGIPAENFYVRAIQLIVVFSSSFQDLS